MKISVELDSEEEMVRFAYFMEAKKNDLAAVLYNRYKERYEVAESLLKELQDKFAALGDESNKAYSKNVNDMEIGNRALNCLLAERIYTVGQLLELSTNDLEKIPNMGKKSIKEIREVLAAQKLYLRGDENNGL